MKEYRLELWRVDTVNNHQRKVSETDFGIEPEPITPNFTPTDTIAKTQADVFASHYCPHIDWYDWKENQHPILRHVCWTREVKNQTEQYVEFIVLYQIYPFQFESEFIGDLHDAS